MSEKSGAAGAAEERPATPVGDEGGRGNKVGDGDLGVFGGDHMVSNSCCSVSGVLLLRCLCSHRPSLFRSLNLIGGAERSEEGFGPLRFGVERG